MDAGTGKQGEEESEAGSDSEESCKSEEIPSEDACTHCGLPNHPELVAHHSYKLLIDEWISYL